MIRLIFALVAVVVLWIAWIIYQNITKSGVAHELMMRKVKELESMTYEALLSRVGQTHQKETILVSGRKFWFGWMAAEPGRMGTYINDNNDASVSGGSKSALDEVEVRMHMDYLTLLPFSDVRTGISFKFVKDRSGQVREIFADGRVVELK